MRRLVPVIAAAALLAGCSSHPATGRVTEKHIEPARSWTSCSLIGKVMICTPYSDDQDWVLRLQAREETWSVEVTPDEYDRIIVGDLYTEAKS